MPPPPKPPAALVTSVTHHTAEISWQRSHQKLISALPAAEGRLKAELQLRRADLPDEEAAWDVVYKGYDARCSVSELQDSQHYLLRFRFGSNSGWSAWSDPRSFTTERRPFNAADLHRCVRLQQEQQLLHALQSADSACVDAPDDKGFSSLMLAALAGSASICDILLQHGADVNWSRDSGKTALMLCSYRGVLTSVEQLIDNGADLERRDRIGMTALHYAVDGEKLDAIKLLLQMGASVRAADSSGCTPLIRCAMLKNNGNVLVAELLVAAGSEIDRKDSVGQNALFYCVLQRHLRMAERLLANGADPLSANEKGVTAMSVAEAQDTSAMGQLLQKFIVERRQAAAK